MKFGQKWIGKTYGVNRIKIGPLISKKDIQDIRRRQNYADDCTCREYCGKSPQRRPRFPTKIFLFVVCTMFLLIQKNIMKYVDNVVNGLK
jgi:hypothetical protein